MQPEKIGRYEIERELGRGGMGQVFLAFDPVLRRHVAIKLLAVQGDIAPQFQGRFEREAKILALLEHPNIIPIYDYGYYEDLPYIVMRYLPGGTLAEQIKGDPLPLAFINEVLQAVAAALDFSHRQEGGIVHRDVKPGNILFDDAGRAHLSDFGLSYLMDTISRTSLISGQFVGTLAYASPEQCQGREADQRSDVYSLGVVLFEMLTGVLPFPDDSPVAVLLKHIQTPPPELLERRPDLDPACAQVLKRALAKDPADRFDSAGELSQAWMQAVTGLAGEAIPAAPSESVPLAPPESDTAGLRAPRGETQVGVQAPPARKSLLPRWGWLSVFAILLAVMLAVAAWAYNASRPATRMEGEFNVAVAEFAVIQPDGSPLNSQDGRAVAEFLFQRLQTSFDQLGLADIRPEVWGPEQTGLVRGDTPEARSRAAEELSSRIGADVLVYGVITASESPQLKPEFYVASRGFEQAGEITGQHDLGSALHVELPFDLTRMQAVENPALSARASALSLIAIGLAYQSVDNMDQALQFINRAEQTPGWLDSAGKEVVYLLLGNAYARQASIQKSSQPLAAASWAFKQALELNPQYARALVGQASVVYLLALGDPNDQSMEDVDLVHLEEAEVLFQQALAPRDSPESARIPVKVHFGMGQVYLARDRAEGGWLEKARSEFRAVTQAYEAGDQQIGDLAAQAYARLGLIAALEADVAQAVEEYQKAIKIASPYYQAQYNARLGEVYAASGQVEQAVGAYEEAIRIAEFYGYADSAIQYTRRLAELKP